MKYVITLLCAVLMGCAVEKKAPCSFKIRSSTTGVIYKIDTLVNGECLYSTYNYVDFAKLGQGSIITKCGCFSINDEVNYNCITSQ